MASTEWRDLSFSIISSSGLVKRFLGITACPSGPQLQHVVSRALSDNFQNFVRPCLQRLAALVEILMAIVNGAYAGNLSALMVQHLVRDLLRNAKLCQAGAAAPSQIMEGPTGIERTHELIQM